MINLSVITIVRNRQRHLVRLIEGLAVSITPPRELIVVDMSDVPVLMPQLAFPSKLIKISTSALILSTARNVGARSAIGERLLFLDVDCIPRRNLVPTMDRELTRMDAVICPEVRYLGSDAPDFAEDKILEYMSIRHPIRDFPIKGARCEPNAGLFWSLAFGIRRQSFEALGGFDEGYVGYGGEDTDFGYKAKEAGLPLLLLGGTGAYHQYHGVLSPPLHHLSDIVRNSNRFFNRWGVWPMVGWLNQFAALGLVAFDDQELRLIRLPNEAELQDAVQPPSIYF